MTKNDTQRFECFIWALATLTEGLSLEDLMPNMSHPASWVGSYQKSSVFPGCLGLDLMFPGSCFVCRAMLIAEKQHLEHGLDMWVSNSGGRPECVCLLVTTQAINVCMASGHFSSTSLWGCTLRERDRRHGLEECLHLASALWFTLCTSFADLKQTEGEWTSDKSVQCQLQIKNDPRHIAKQLHSVIISWWWRQSWSSAARCKHLASEQRFIVPMEAHLWTVKQWVPSCSKKYTRKQWHLYQHSGCLNLRSLQEAKLVHWGCHQHR